MFGSAGCLRTGRDDDIYLEAHQFVRERWETIQFFLCISRLDDDVFPLHVPKLAQTLAERLAASRDSGRGDGNQESDPGDFRWLLRQCLNHTDECEHESEIPPHFGYFDIAQYRFWIADLDYRKKNPAIAPKPFRSLLAPIENPKSFYRITLSALAKTLGGTVNPICLVRVKIDHQFELLRLLHGNIGGLYPFENSVYIRCGPAI